MFTRGSYIHLATRISCAVFSAALLSQLSACGTLFCPERRGQIDSRVDPVIVAFGAIGLLLYIIPGLIAFGVDFATSTIYLPGAKYLIASEVLKDTVGADGKVDNRKLKAILEREIDRGLLLDDPRLIHHSGSVEQLVTYGLKPAT